MKYIAPDGWKPCDGIKLEDSAWASVTSTSNVLVVAGPGAGKTELLAQKAGYLFQTNLCHDPQKILAISFKKDAASNLKDRVVKRCGKDISDRFVSLTYDAFFKGILDQFRCALPESIRPNAIYNVEEEEIVCRAFEKAGFTNEQNLSKSRLKAYYSRVIESVTLPFSKDDLAEKVWALLLKGFDGYSATLTFRMISILAEFIVKTNSKIKKCLQLTYSHVFLDEFQDTTALQYNLVKQCFLNSDSILTAVGDSKQCIMLWAGALKTVFENYVNDFNAVTQRLVMNYRSAPKLVKLQQMMYASLNEHNFDISVSDKWNEDDGRIVLLATENEQNEAQSIAADISQKLSNGVEPCDLCILCKQKPQEYTKLIIDELAKKNIYARIENEYQDLKKEPIINIIFLMLRLSVNKKSPNDWVATIDLISIIWGIDSDQNTNNYFEMQEKLSNEIDLLAQFIKNVSTKEKFAELLNLIVDFCGLSHIKAAYPEYRREAYLLDIIKEYQKLMWEELERTDFDWMLAFENFEGMHSVPIMTIHKSKGLEFNSVYFIGLEDSAFWNFDNQPEEDRCAFFVALSRAKSEIRFTFCQYRNLQRSSLQSHDKIQEFFDLLLNSGFAELVK